MTRRGFSGRTRAVYLMGTVLLAAAATTAGAAPALAGNPHAAPTTCSSLSTLRLGSVDGYPTRVIAASEVPATPAAPAHCDVRGSVVVSARHSTSTIQFQVQVPAQGWNRRYLQLGGGGFCGSIPTAGGSSADAPLSAGYAVASDDGGHTGGGLDGSFGYHNYAAELTWGKLSEHLTSLAAKRLLAGARGQRPLFSYFVGCSTGGRQALVEAQEFPHDFDGIVAGAPANRQNELAPLSQGVRELQNRDANHNVILDAAAAATVHAAVLAQCDKLDGLADGVVGDPRLCPLDLDALVCQPGQTTDCLTPQQLDVVRKWYDSPRTANGRELYPGGLPVGSELGWPGFDIGSDSSFSGSGLFAEQVLRYLAFPKDPGPTYSLYDFDPSHDAGKLHALDHVYNADSTNMRAFQRQGGKLIMWQGFADPLITPLGTIQYYEDVVKAQGSSLSRTQSWFRTFFLPGVYHCSGGPGPDQVDWLSAISSWVEGKNAPERLVATKVDSQGLVTMQRPIYPYPLEARYAGGPVQDLSSYVPVAGPRGRSTLVHS